MDLIKNGKPSLCSDDSFVEEKKKSKVATFQESLAIFFTTYPIMHFLSYDF